MLGVDKKSLCTVKNKKRKDWEERLNVLKMNLETIIKDGNEREINVIHTLLILANDIAQFNPRVTI